MIRPPQFPESCSRTRRHVSITSTTRLGSRPCAVGGGLRRCSGPGKLGRRRLPGAKKEIKNLRLEEGLSQGETKRKRDKDEEEEKKKRTAEKTEEEEEALVACGLRRPKPKFPLYKNVIACFDGPR